jgi:hypothetical protein
MATQVATLMATPMATPTGWCGHVAHYPNHSSEGTNVGIYEQKEIEPSEKKPQERSIPSLTPPTLRLEGVRYYILLWEKKSGQRGQIKSRKEQSGKGD